MKRCYGKSGWCSACNQWQIIIIVILFLSLSTYGIFKLTQDPYRTIMGPLCNLPQPLPKPIKYYHTAYDSIPVTWILDIYGSPVDDIDTSEYWKFEMYWRE